MSYNKKEIYEMRHVDRKSYKDIARETGLSTNQVDWAIYTYRKGLKNNDLSVEIPDGSSVSNEVYKYLSKPRSKEEICDRFGLTEGTLGVVIEELQNDGKMVEDRNEVLSLCKTVVPSYFNAHDKAWNGEKIIRFGLCGDKHFNSKYVQITHMNTLYDIYEREGINTVYDTGDLDEGEKMRPGHEYECYNQGADDHVDEIINNHPRRKSITTEFITGNHDHSLIKRAGYDIGYPIARERDDMVYLGQSFAVVNLTPNCTLELRHPMDGSSYAISYKTQKMIDAMSGGEKPNILGIGHYHKAEYIFYRNIQAYQAGTLQGQSSWMKGKGLAAHLGGWMIEVYVDDEGTVTRVQSVFFPFYKAIVDDYKNWR